MLTYVFITVIMTIYTLIASFALQMTYSEQCATNNTSTICNVLSVIACVFWPLTMLTVAVAVHRSNI
jgi:uncharacterized protein involved in cysteine biosynthesis